MRGPHNQPASPGARRDRRAREVRSGAIDPAERSRARRSSERERDPFKFLHQIELLSARSKVRRRSGSGIPSKSRKGWNSVIASRIAPSFQPPPGCGRRPGNHSRRSRPRQTCSRDRLKLVRQFSADADSRNRSLHVRILPISPVDDGKARSSTFCAGVQNACRISIHV